MEKQKIINIAINGFGRIGRLAFRRMFPNKSFNIVAINDLTDTKTLAHLLKYDSAHGKFTDSENKLVDIKSDDSHIIINGHKIPIYKELDPSKLPWKTLKVDIVVECTGIFTTKVKAGAHIQAGAKKVLISAPAGDDLPTIVYNVNHKILKASDNIVSAASCTTNALALMAKVLDDNFGIESGFMNTIHAFTADQNLQDAPHRDFRRARAASASIIPTSTGAASAIGLVIPSLKGKLAGLAMRVPTISGSIVDLTVTLEKDASVSKINEAMKKAANKNDSFFYEEDLIVSSDIIGDTHGSIFDPNLTMELSTNGKKSFKVFAWYDNEYSYVSQFVRLLELMASHI